MFCFNLKDEFNIRTHITYTSWIFRDFSIDPYKIFLSYQQMINKLDLCTRTKYLKNLNKDIKIQSTLTKTEDDARGKIFGIDAYLFYRAKEKKIDCFVSKKGELIYGGVKVTIEAKQTFEPIKNLENMKENKLFDELGQDSKKLPSIDDYEY